MSATNTTSTLAYWDIIGFAQPIRYLLKYAGIDFNDKRYVFSNEKEWQSVKSTLGLDFPNLPYYIDGDIKLTQSLAILRYLGRKHRLVATDDQTLVRQDMAEQQIQDMRDGLFNIIMNPDYETREADYCTGTLEPQLDLLVKFMGDKEWLSGQLSYVDFMAYEILDWFRLFSSDTIAKYPVITRYMARFEVECKVGQPNPVGTWARPTRTGFGRVWARAAKRPPFGGLSYNRALKKQSSRGSQEDNVMSSQK
ncbi:unnamed protein product [Oppiella nova]|uniref:glutathione transferase n=1 Tax=Oppiella nova TaxID=334625 RepID=A0A7R9QVH9_9ACAR|nr:unnamed protein product [Oppiella nova]CAG2177142.1 unnamed protein product [Oppiella nova]